MKLLDAVKARIPSMFPYVAAAVVLGGGGVATYRWLHAGDCCAQGADCCRPGAACCLTHKNHGAHAAADSHAKPLAER